MCCSIKKSLCNECGDFLASPFLQVTTSKIRRNQLFCGWQYACCYLIFAMCAQWRGEIELKRIENSFLLFYLFAFFLMPIKWQVALNCYFLYETFLTRILRKRSKLFASLLPGAHTKRSIELTEQHEVLCRIIE